MNKDLKYRAICPLCGKLFDSRNGKLSPDGKVVCQECYEHFGFATYIWTAYEGYNADNADKQPEAEDFEKNQYPEFVPKDWSECYKLPTVWKTCHDSWPGRWSCGILPSDLIISSN